MAKSFWINASQFNSTSAAGSLESEVRSHTGCDSEAESIVRSIERLGSDPSIRRYEMSPSRKASQGRTSPTSWSVRAVRD